MITSLRKSLLTVHILSSVSWIGALLAFLALALAGSAGADMRTREASAYAMALIAWKVILPLCAICVASGLVLALEGRLLRAYWVLFKLVFGVVATGVLLLKLQPIYALAQLPASAADHGAGGLRLSLTVHAVGGLVLLLGSAVLGIYKPRGVLPRRGEMSSPAAPLWLKVAGGALAALLLLLIVMAAGGKHGPWMHSSSPTQKSNFEHERVDIVGAPSTARGLDSCSTECAAPSSAGAQGWLADRQRSIRNEPSSVSRGLDSRRGQFARCANEHLTRLLRHIVGHSRTPAGLVHAQREGIKACGP